MNTPENVLLQTFGYTSFRQGQKELIDAILSGRDVCGIMPTGAGKSLCYQVPALLLPGVTLVISPLISLMRDQVLSLVAAGVSAAFLNSSLTEQQYATALSRARAGLYKIIYIAPERLGTASMDSLIRELEISMVAVDEAHCISKWGQDFRPSYLEIPAFINKLPRRPVVTAFTATATSHVREDIRRALELTTPLIKVTGFDRPNLFFTVKQPRDKYAALSNYLQDNDNCGIVYCATRKEVDKVTASLLSDGYSAAAYHAGLSDAARTNAQDDFIHDRVQIIVATNAFGMGIDKSNVRFVIHYNMPQNVEAYYQEAGRAGRDGLPADCILFFARRDIVIAAFLITQSENPEEVRRNRRLLNKMVQLCEGKECLRNYLLNYFGEATEEDCGNCGNCIADEILEEEPVHSHIDIKKATISDSVTGAKTQGFLHKLRSAKTHSKKRSSKEKVPAFTFSSTLFAKLKALRLEIANEQKVPAFVIFSDATLVDMCQKHPLTPEEFLKISGVGQVKLERFGERFLAVLADEERSTDAPVQPPELTTELLFSEIIFEDKPIQITKVSENINAVLLKYNAKKASAVALNKLLLKHNYLEDSTGIKLPTAEGSAAGIATTRRKSSYGEYEQCLFDENAQKLCAALYVKENPL